MMMRKGLLEKRNLLLLGGINLAISLLLTFIAFPALDEWGRGFLVNAFFTFPIGTSIYILAFAFGIAHKVKWYYMVINYLLIFCGGGGVGTLVGYVLTKMFFPHATFNVKGLLANNLYLAIFFGIVGSVIVTGRLKIKEMVALLAEKKVNEERLKTLKAKAELEALKAKINPHFLFNTLNSIVSLIDGDPKGAEEMVLRLSALFQSVLEFSSKTFIPLKRELELVEMYLNIEQVRFGDRLSYDIVCHEGLKEMRIPSLIMQPIVENAVKHGVSQLLEKGRIKIHCFSNEDNVLHIKVSDNGKGVITGKNLYGFGIQSVKDKLSLLYSHEAGLEFHTGRWTTVTIKIPVDERKESELSHRKGPTVEIGPGKEMNC